MAARDFDVVLYGATGFVGRLAAEYLASCPGASGLSWALAGRDRGRLQEVRDLAGAKAEILVADSGDAQAVFMMANRARVLLNTAGPFARYGDSVVDACVRAKTHYVDITGETVWVRSLIDRHHERAAAEGTRIIPFCGFDSVPSDLGSFLVARRLRQELGAGCSQVEAFFRLRGGVNGGTIASDIARRESAAAERVREPFLLNPERSRSFAAAVESRDPSGVRYHEQLGAWVGPFVMGPVNTRVVRRSAALFEQWGEPYGEGFRYQEYSRFDGRLGHAKAALVSTLLAGFERAMSGAGRRALLKQVLPKPGQGPSRMTMDRGWFDCVLIGAAAVGGQVRGLIYHQGDPGNRATARFVCEAALALALEGDQLPGGLERGGLLTPATGLGEVLARRLRGAGTTIEIGHAG